MSKATRAIIRFRVEKPVASVESNVRVSRSSLRLWWREPLGSPVNQDGAAQLQRDELQPNKTTDHTDDTDHTARKQTLRFAFLSVSIRDIRGQNSLRSVRSLRLFLRIAVALHFIQVTQNREDFDRGWHGWERMRVKLG